MLSVQRLPRSNPRQPLLLLDQAEMRTVIYVDGFNLYYRLLARDPGLKWLNVKGLAETVLQPENQIIKVRYYTARVSGRTDPSGPARQQIYLNALRSVPEISIHMGTFLVSEKFAGLARPPVFRPVTSLPEPWPDVVKIIKTEEKGSDVNLASHLLLDAFQSLYDVACVVSNDSDLVEPIRIVTRELGKPVGLLSPVANPNPELKSVSSFIRRIHRTDLVRSQFPDPIPLPDGSLLSKPETWT